VDKPRATGAVTATGGAGLYCGHDVRKTGPPVWEWDGLRIALRCRNAQQGTPRIDPSTPIDIVAASFVMTPAAAAASVRSRRGTPRAHLGSGTVLRFPIYGLVHARNFRPAPLPVKDKHVDKRRACIYIITGLNI
jgi:hypothetical protein